MSILPFTGITTLDIYPDRVLDQAIGKLNDVVVIGTTLDGLSYFASSSGNGPNILWHLERLRYELLKQAD